MGLTIHYSLKSNAGTAVEARAQIEQLRVYARGLLFADVGEIVEVEGADDCDHERLDPGDPRKWLLVQAAQPIRLVVDGEAQWQAVSPERLVAFSIDPGDGCEQANIGLCRYPETIEIGGRQTSTGLHGWCWASFCKTQFRRQRWCSETVVKAIPVGPAVSPLSAQWFSGARPAPLQHFTNSLMSWARTSGERADGRLTCSAVASPEVGEGCDLMVI